MPDKQVVFEVYCFSCGRFIRKQGGDQQDTQPVIITIYETCAGCALKKAKEE